MRFPTLEPYGWGDRWEALFAEVDGTPDAPDDATAPSATPGTATRAGGNADGPTDEPDGATAGGATPAAPAGDAEKDGAGTAEAESGTAGAGADSDIGAAGGAGAGADREEPGVTGTRTGGEGMSVGRAGADDVEAGVGGASADGEAVVPGRVLRHDGVAVAVALPDGVASRPLRRGLDPAPVVGDWVVEQAGTLRAVLPRSSLLERKSARREQPQALAANVDVVLVVCGLDRPVRAGRIQRTATLAWEAGAVPTVVLTKADQAGQGASDEAAEQVLAENPGLDVLVTSARTGQGADALRAAVKDRTVVLVGESGAGKSSLVNLLLDTDAVEVGDVRKGDFKGRHTTTSRELHVVPTGGVVIDTPGIRSVGLWADAEAVATTFDDIDELATGCRFADCRHDTEPGCAVRAAIEEGTLAADRLERWRALEREAVAAERRADPHAQKVWGRSFARITKDAQRRKGRS